MSDTHRWGFIEDGEFIPVPKVPLTLGGFVPPVTFQLYGGERTIIAEPDACPLRETCADPGAAHEPCHPGGCEFCQTEERHDRDLDA